MDRTEPVVEREIDLEAGPEEVWDALTRTELLEGWLGDDARIDAEPGGHLVVRTEDGELREGVVQDADPPERLRFHWWADDAGTTSTVEFRIVALPGGGTRLRVTETRLVTPVAAGLGWAAPLARLRMAPVA